MRTMRTMRSTSGALALAAVALLVAGARDAGAQQGTRRPVRRQQPIEIRGQVPTPQVVTVRPREVPQYNRRFLVPNFYDHDFWPAILPGYQLVSRRLITGNVRLDSLTAGGADSAQLTDNARLTAQARAALGTGLFYQPPGNGTNRLMMPTTPGDSTRRQMMPGAPAPGATTRRTPPASDTTTGGTPPASRPR